MTIFAVAAFAARGRICADANLLEERDMRRGRVAGLHHPMVAIVVSRLACRRPRNGRHIPHLFFLPGIPCAPFADEDIHRDGLFCYRIPFFRAAARCMNKAASRRRIATRWKTGRHIPRRPRHVTVVANVIMADMSGTRRGEPRRHRLGADPEHGADKATRAEFRRVRSDCWRRDMRPVIPPERQLVI